MITHILNYCTRILRLFLTKADKVFAERNIYLTDLLLFLILK